MENGTGDSFIFFFLCILHVLLLILSLGLDKSLCNITIFNSYRAVVPNHISGRSVVVLTYFYVHSCSSSSSS